MAVARLPLAAFVAATASAATAEELAFRVALSAPAPWMEPGAFVPETIRVGSRLTLDGGTLAGPPPLACDGVRTERHEAPPEGLFEGSLPAPADASAERLGIAGPVPVLRVLCPNLSLDLAFADEETALLAVDNRILTLSSAPGALAAEGTPEAVVQRFLEVHMGADMGFMPESVAWKAPLMMPQLAGAAVAYFTVARPPDEVPLINGDPFTDAQEYPTRFAVGTAAYATAGSVDTAEVAVRFADAYGQRNVVYRLTRVGDRWLVGDLVYEDGSHLSDLLAE